MRKANSTSLFDQVISTVETHRMFSSGDRVLTAVSGGPDSTALLRVLIELAPRLGLELGVFHLDHGLRPEAEAEAEHVARWAEKLGVPAHIEAENVRSFCKESGLGIQAGAREVRYRRLRETADEHGFNKIAVGHTADDVVETFLMRLIRGSGPVGLGSIPPVREKGIVRPLIEARRDDIVRFLRVRGIEYLEDPSNLDRKYFRSRVRHDLAPQLAAFNPRFAERILSTVKILREEEELVAGLAERAYADTARPGPGEVSFELSALRALGPALARRVLRRAVTAVGRAAEGIDFDHYDALWRELVSGAAAAWNLPGDLRAVREGNALVIYRVPAPIADTIINPGEKFGAPGLTVSLTIKPRGETRLAGDGSIYADAGAIVWPLKLRSAAPGDSFRPLGLGGSKKIHDYFIDAKIPRRGRPRIPVFADAEKVVGVGARVDERVKVTDKTKDVAVIETVQVRDFGPG